MKNNYRSIITIHFGSISERGVLASLRCSNPTKTSVSPVFFLPVLHWSDDSDMRRLSGTTPSNGNPQIPQNWTSGNRGAYVGHTYHADRGLRPVFKLQCLSGFVVLESDSIVVHDECPRCIAQLW